MKGFLAIALMILMSSPVLAEGDFQRVQVADAYMEMRTGPGRGFPIFHVVERGEWVDISKRRTDWFKVRTDTDKEGWVNRRQMESTLTQAGIEKSFRDVLVDDFLSRRLEVGFGAGEFDGDPVLSIRSSYKFSEYFLGELTLSQVSGDFSSSKLYHANLVLQPYPESRLSPYFTLGAGRFENEPKATLVNDEDIEEPAANVGVGVRAYITRRFLFRVDFKHYVVFIDDDSHEEFQEWVAGFSFFF